MRKPPRKLRWTCHACGRSRPDRRISVFSRPLFFTDVLAPGYGKVTRVYDTHRPTIAVENVRYCNDCMECFSIAVNDEDCILRGNRDRHSFVHRMHWVVYQLAEHPWRVAVGFLGAWFCAFLLNGVLKWGLLR